MTKQMTKRYLGFIRVIRMLQSFHPPKVPMEFYYTTTIDTIGSAANDTVHKNPRTENKTAFYIENIKYFMNDKITNVSKGNQNANDYLNDTIENLMSKNKDKEVENLVLECLNMQKIINELTLKKMFQHYSLSGKPDTVIVLQQYCEKVDPNLSKRNGEFMHYLAKAQCVKGNPEKGLSILLQGYVKFENLRNLYRNFFRELIQDSVRNGSEATLVVFKKYVLQFSNEWEDHYPLICFWHLCWSSSWFSDQMLSNELLDSSTALQDIIRDRSTAFCIIILKYDYNDDAVLRLLQALLKYKMMTEYAKVLQILFDYKLKKRDLRGCTEIIKNCEVLGVTLPSYQQGRYIRMLIDTDHEKPKKPETKTFKFKF